VTICVLVIEQEEKAYELWEKLQEKNAQITNFKIIEPHKNLNENSLDNKYSLANFLPTKMKIDEVKLFNPIISRKERQRKMATWLMPFGFIAGLTFSGMTDLRTFSSFGFGSSMEPFIGGLLGMGSGFIGSFFAARSVNTNQDDLKSLFKFNEQGKWLIILETALEIEPPWELISQINPIELINLNEI